MTDATVRRRTPPKAQSLTELIQGDRLCVEGRELIPIVRVTSLAKRRAHLERDRVEAQAGGFVNLRPVAVLDMSEDSEQRLPIRNEAARTIAWLILASMVIPGLVALLNALSRRLRLRRSQHPPA